MFVTSGTAFKAEKLKNFRKFKNDLLLSFVLDMHLPHFVWVMEISPIEDYKNRMAKAEILIDATSNELDSEALYARIGNRILFEVTEQKSESYPASFPQFCHNLRHPSET